MSEQRGKEIPGAHEPDGAPTDLRARVAELEKELQRRSQRESELLRLEEQLREAHSESECRIAARTSELRRVVRKLELEAAEHQETTAALARTNEQLKEKAAQLEEARRKAEALASAKTDLLANMSHELRTPMTAILGFADLLQDVQERSTGRGASGEDLEHEQRRHLEMIRVCGAQLLNLINDILDMSRIERHHMHLQHSPVDLTEVVAEVCAMMRATAGERQLELGVRYLTPIPETLHTDKTALTRILMNLTGNAVKFTERGSVTIEVSFAMSEGRGRISFDVIDTGIGINKEHLESLFLPFRRIEGGSTRITPGTGLGLWISRELVRLLGGDIAVQSTPGEGSSFRFWLPCSAADARALKRVDDRSVSAPQAGAPQPLTGRELPYRILVAEDVETNQILIERILKKAGARVSLAKDGGAAVTAALEAIQAGDPYDVILMDMVMPVLTGYEAVQILRSRGFRRPILALTASAMGSDQARCLEVGCDGYLTKPINRAELIATIKQHAGVRTFREEAERDSG